MTEEPRKSRRQRTLKAGKITFGSGASIDCVVRNVAGNGANLEVESSVGIPDRFELVISKDELKHQCRVIWRQAKRIGVRFD